MKSNSNLSISSAQYEALASTSVHVPSTRELFDHQVETLVSCGIAMYHQADAFLDKLPKQGLILWIPRQFCSDELSGLLWQFEGSGHPDIKDRYEVPGNHLCMDVEDGRHWMGARDIGAGQKISAMNRRPYALIHGIIHSIVFPYTLNHHDLACLGSKEDHHNWDVGISMNVFNYEGRASITYVDLNKLNWGIPSFGQWLLRE